LIVASLPLEYKSCLIKLLKKFCNTLVDTAIKFLITQNRLKNEEDNGLKLERSLKLIFQKNWSKLSLILVLYFQHCFFKFDIQRSFVALQFIGPMTPKKTQKKKKKKKKNTQFGKGMRKKSENVKWYIHVWWWVILPYKEMGD